MADQFDIRPATAGDTSAILELLASSLGWANDRSFLDFYEWKHDANPFGPSARWVASEAARIVGFRAFLRWELEHDGRVLRAVRAVDTATAPEAQGRGVFRQLTLHALEDLERDGVDLVFNTPNDRSGQGYLTMGWHDVGRVPRRIRPRSLAGTLRLLRARGGASGRWSEPTTVGRPASEVLTDPSPVDAILRTRTPATALRTTCSIDYLRWRYAGIIPARAVAHPDGPDHGVAFVRVRQRGSARVALLGDVLVPHGDPALERALVRRVATTVDADGTAALGRVARQSAGFWPIGGSGPRLVARSLASAAPASLDGWDLGYGDLELL
jgi:GNAT superfamily N-acetyltransferase